MTGHMSEDETFDDFWMWAPEHVPADQLYHVCIIYKDGIPDKLYVNGKERST